MTKRLRQAEIDRQREIEKQGGKEHYCFMLSFPQMHKLAMGVPDRAVPFCNWKYQD